jgi:type VI secretion system protein
MTLTLVITNVDKLDNGVANRIRLDRHGAVIGRSPTADWSLPDPQHYISSVHCEVDYRDGVYTLVDKSTNGTFMNGGQARMAGPHPICEGDVILIGHYQVACRLEGAADAPAAAPSEPAWGGWKPQAAAPGADAASWDRPPPQAAISGQGAMSQNWAPPPVDAPPKQDSVWGPTPTPIGLPPSGFSSPISDGAANPSASDVWGELAAGNVVDWARGGFGEPQREAGDPLGLGAGGVRVQPDPLGLATAAPSTPAPPSPAQGGWAPPAEAAAPSWGPPAAAGPVTIPPQSGGATGWAPPGAAQPQSPAAPSAPAAAPLSPGVSGGELAAFLAGAGLAPTDLKTSGPEALAAAGLALRRIVAGLVVMLEARARAKAQLGAQGTSLEFDGNNPLKFARAPEKAVAQLLNPPERGFMSAERAVEDAFRDLQAHQMATLVAMQGALAATLARFSPEAIRGRAENKGLMSKILPGAREAALWQAYEREFEGVAKGSDEAFMDVFAKEFRLAYERVAAEMKRKA